MKILVTLNGSAKSERAIPLVVELARRWQAEVLVVRALDPVGGTGNPLVPLVVDSVYQAMVKVVEDYLLAVSSLFEGVPLRTFSLTGGTAQCIRDLAVREECDLIVMASRGYTGFVRWLWGSVAEGMARVAPCPVLLVRRDRPTLWREILVPVDGSVPSCSVLEKISRFLEPTTRVTLLHCSAITEVEEMVSPSAREQAYQVRSQLKKLVEDKPWHHLEFSSAAAPQGIFDWLEDHDCDLIAMSTHGREGLAHFWTGSIMEQVARHANCPVLVFPPALVKAQQIS